MKKRKKKNTNSFVNVVGDTFYNIKATVWLMGRDYLKNKGYWFFGIVYPFLLFSILSNALPKGISIGLPIQIIVFAGIQLSVISYLCVNVLAVTLVIFKNSTIIKSIGVTPLKSWELITGVLIVYISGAFFFSETLWIWLYVYNPGDSALIHHFNFGIYLVGLILMMLLSCGIGFIIAGGLKNPASASAIGLVVYLITAFLSGQFFPTLLIDNTESLKIISIIFPQRHIYDLFILSLNSNYYNTAHSQYIWKDNLLWLSVMYPIFWIIGAYAIIPSIFKIKNM